MRSFTFAAAAATILRLVSAQAVTLTTQISTVTVTQTVVPTGATTQTVVNGTNGVVTYYGLPIWNPPTVTASSSVSAAAFYASSTSTSSTSSAKPSPTGPSGHAAMYANGNKWAMTYTPYTASSGCKDAGTIYSDMAALAAKGFAAVRVYSTDCGTLQNIGGAARAAGLKMILGVFISSSGVGGAQGQVDQIAAWAQWDLVQLIVVGNEAVFAGYTNGAQLAGFVGSAKGQFRAAGYTGPVTATEDMATMLQIGSQLCGVVDVIAANLYAFFNPNATPDQAGSFVVAEVNQLAGVCPGKEVFVTESGWPSAGGCNGAACPGYPQQAQAIAAIEAAIGWKTALFSYEDELWKGAGPLGVEQHWGAGHLF